MTWWSFGPLRILSRFVNRHDRSSGRTRRHLPSARSPRSSRRPTRKQLSHASTRPERSRATGSPATATPQTEEPSILARGATSSRSSRRTYSTKASSPGNKRAATSSRGTSPSRASSVGLFQSRPSSALRAASPNRCAYLESSRGPGFSDCSSASTASRADIIAGAAILLSDEIDAIE